MNNTVLFFTEKETPRLRYTVQTIVGNFCGLNFVFTQDKAHFVSANLPKINYSDVALAAVEIMVKPQGLLFDSTVKLLLMDDFWAFFNRSKPKMGRKPTLSDDTVFELDIFSIIFFLVSRYEEYTCPPSVLDAYGRFPSTESAASKGGFLQYPLVNHYTVLVSEKLKDLFPNIKITAPTYKFQPTFDIDMAWFYKNKGFARHLGGFTRDLLKGQFKSVKKRAAILRGVADDPFFNFDYIQKIHQEYGFKPVVFWLLGDLGKYDKNISWNHPEFQALIRSFAVDLRVGVHPSYRSNEDLSILKKEVGRLESILNLPKNGVYTEGVPFPSRQHFLKLRFPDTYRRLLDVGIREDWSMGYADETGFRAGIASPFPWFDLELNEETPLIIHPFQAMDVTLNNYLHLSPDAVAERFTRLIEVTKEVGGTFTTLWHNESLSETEGWKGWRRVYEDLLKAAV